MSGVDVGLPDNYGLEHERLAGLLKRWREEHARARGPSESERADERLRELAARVDTSRRPATTAVVAAACLAVFGWEVAALGWNPSARELADAGGASLSTFTGGGWWILVTGNLHADAVHLLVNLASFSVGGYLLEREIGFPRTAILCALGGVASMELAIVVRPDAVTVGLSGVVSAVLAGAVVRDAHRTRALGTLAWTLLPANLVYTFLVPGISVGGHVGGLAAGLAVSALYEKRGRAWRPLAEDVR